MKNRMAFRMRTARLIGFRGFKASIYGFGLYFVTLAGTVTGAVSTSIYVGTVWENGLLIVSNPLGLPLYLSIIIGAAYLAIAASISVSRERDSGSLEVLFYGPVDAVSYILGKYVEQMLAFIVMLAFYSIVFFIFGTLTNFGFSSDAVLSMVLSFALTSSVAAFGIVLSSFTSNTRASVLGLVALLVMFVGVQWGESFLAGLDSSAISPVLFYARSFLSVVARLVAWISPFACFNRGIQALAVGNISVYAASFASSVVYTFMFLALAIVGLRKKGVRS